MNKKTLKGLFKGCQILEVVGNKVALLSEDKHEAFVSSVTKDDSGALVEGGKTAVNATVVFGEGENEVKVGLDSVIETFKTKTEELQNELTDKDKTIKAFSEANEKMKKAETDRRKEAVKNTIISRFADIKTNSDADFADNECDDLLTDEKVDEYACMEDKDGKFIGDEEARKAVDARCMSKIIEKKKQTKVNQFAWDIAKDGKEKSVESGVESSIANILK